MGRQYKLKAVHQSVWLILTVLMIFACQKSENNYSDENNLISFFIPNYRNYGDIDQDQQTVKLYLGANVNLSSITPVIEISSGAIIEPFSGQKVDLTFPKEYTVTAANGISRTYLVSATQYTDTALMIVDVQNGYFPFYNDSLIVTNIRSLIIKARNANRPVIFIQSDYTSPNGIRDSPINTLKFQIPSTLIPGQNDIYLIKRCQDSFDESTGILPIINEKHVGSFVVCGIATQLCVAATIAGGIDKGYRIIVAADAHSSYDPSAQSRIDYYNTEIWPELGASVIYTNHISF
jgi:nicotinamidase-related amidase